VLLGQASLDLHGNITARMAACADFLCGNHLNPHTDCYERGHEAFMMLPRLLGGELTTHTHVEHLPMLVRWPLRPLWRPFWLRFT
jgi:microcystin degradation protein MlrC